MASADRPAARGAMPAEEGAGRSVGPRVWEVAALVHAVADTLAARFASVAVRGEVSGYTRAASGHCYFTLKDAEGTAALRCAMFRRAASLLDFAPEEGHLVELRGRLAVYEPRGELQFVVESMQRAGAGALYERFLRLKAQLEAEGLFDAARKRTIVRHPACIGVVTSLAAAALHDVLTALQRRAPQVRVIVYPSPVQGAEAPAALAAAIEAAGRHGRADTLIVARGGGSLEDLWAFNEALVVRAVAASRIPVIAGIGHETDVSLVDFAADLRAPTPTAAAELAAMPREEALAVLHDLARRARRGVALRLDSQAQRLDRTALRLARPAQALAPHRERLALLSQRQRTAMHRHLERQQQRQAVLASRWMQAARQLRLRAVQRLDVLVARLGALDPQRVLSRGYAWLGDAEGRALTSVNQLQPGQAVKARLADGRIEAQVIGIEPDKPRR
ncbi:exodeoxyribonuclease VII large subunit [Methylibium petroleiphilum]|uniref:exodeoxyribonuclease VII large subunit n=1 Tax=Methylibium petroleiphilum TaxID=105560 RepID=UPI0023563550|nr:exodeoxyribonuclease VII large subunit [Methylibium petroleiphilum]